MPCEVSDEFLQDPLMQVPMIDPPRGKMSEVVRNWVDGVSGWALVNRTLISHVRVVESMGNAGRQLAGLLRNVRKDAHHMFGQAQADLMNAFQKMKTGAQYQEFVRHLDEGTAVADADVQLAVDAFRTHQKFLENGLVRQGTKVMMADGKSKLLGETLVPNFFPHQHDWDKIMKDEEMVQKMVDQLETAYPGLLPKDGIRDPRRFIEDYRKSASLQKMPKFSSLFERNVKLPGWMGDPNMLASSGEKAYKADVQHSVMGYLEDAYTMFSANRHLGAPKGYRFDDGDMMTNLEPIHRALKKELDSADDAANVARAAGTEPDVSRAFSSPKATERLAAQGNTNAQELIEEVAGQFKPKSFENSTGKWKADTLLQAIGKEGFDANLAGDLVENVLGSKYYSSNERKLSSWLRNYNVVTKLGTLVIENIGQMTVTSTKVGLRTSLKSLRDVVTDWQGSVEFARTAGALTEDAMRGLEADAGRNFAGKFLERSGFRFTELLLRTHAAISGKHYVRELLTRVGTNPMDEQALRQLRKLEFKTDDIVKDGQLTELGARMTNSVGSDSKLEEVITRLAGFETSRQTQFLADVMEMPAAAASPIGKIVAQYKSFVFNSTKFMMRDVMDEAAHGTASMARSAAGLAKGDTALAARELSQAAREFAPMVRLVLTGVAMGEATQSARALAQGEDPAQRGQAGWIRDLIGSDIPREDNAAMVFLGQRFVKNDVAARMIENMLSIGYGGVFSAMLQNAITGGKMRTMAFIAGPSADSALDIAAGVGKAFQGNPEALGRRVLREGGSALGGLVPIKGVAFAGAALGKQAQIAALPTSSQMERSAYLTVDEQREQVMKRVEKRVRDTRQLVRNAVANGNTQEAAQIISNWNAGASQELGMLREVGALGHGSFESITFDRDEISRMMEGEEATLGAFEQAADRVQERF